MPGRMDKRLIFRKKTKKWGVLIIIKFTLKLIILYFARRAIRRVGMFDFLKSEWHSIH